MAERIVFRQVDIDRTDYRDDTGQWVLERSFTEGPRGGRQTVWHLYEVRDDRLHEVAVERRLRDIWKHISEETL
jgi:hypothetical protein